MEGLEVLVTYGYKLKKIDMYNVCYDVIQRIDDDLKYRLLKVLKICLAHIWRVQFSK
jgi:hypothetical protein